MSSIEAETAEHSDADADSDTAPLPTDTQDELPQTENLKSKGTEEKYIYPHEWVLALLSGSLYACNAKVIWFSQDYASCNYSNLPSLPPEA